MLFGVLADSNNKIPTFKYCKTCSHLVPLQQRKYKSMIKRKYHIIYMDIHPSTIEAHCSRKEQCVFFMNKIEQCSLLILYPHYANSQR
ncbi:hypothetical protein HMPREF3226_01048 [Prevotella corporis]|uniref:Uncharacterized protein n=1 Tax=Prevotella corporis TaxID=28128 RepID=A0A133QC97_9BACT|nr:hypothetical protein HMPREF3226_01048 [Prevotella corporis]